MKLICPSCGAHHSADAWANDADARQALLLAGRLPSDIGKHVFGYIAMFREPQAKRSMQWAKVLRLLAEIEHIANAPFIGCGGKPDRPNRPGFWGKALETIIERPPKDLPLKSHGYLTRIAYDQANAADKATEIKAIRLEHQGKSVVRQEEEKRAWLDPEWMRKVRMEKIGRSID